MNVGTILGSTCTAIKSCADDIILMSSTGLQEMINKCVNYGINHKIKFNSTKTEFIISGKSTIKCPFLYIDCQRVRPQATLTHLGFHWKLHNGHEGNIADIQSSHINHRVSEFWAATTCFGIGGNTVLSSLYHSYPIQLFVITKIDLPS